MDSLTPIPGYETRYLISEFGQVFSVRSGRFLKQVPEEYLKVMLYGNGPGKFFKVHQLMSLTFFGGSPLDHRDRNKYNNARSNMRPTTPTQNQGNKGIQRNNRSGIKGVSWETGRRKWRALIGIGGRVKNLGRFDSKEEAAAAYRVAAIEHFGPDFAFSEPSKV